MKTKAVVFPHQLFYDIALFEGVDEIVVIEEALFFKQFGFHKQKLVFHRSSMRQFADFLRGEGFRVLYIEANDAQADIREFLLRNKEFRGRWRIINPVDDWLRRRIIKWVGLISATVDWVESPNFLRIEKENLEYQSARKTYFQTDYYQFFRKQQKILMSADGKPMGGKYSFDAENRKALKADIEVPQVHFPLVNEYVKEAREYVQAHFEKNPGKLAWDDTEFYPTNREEAKQWLGQFLERRFVFFGDYEDAIVTDTGKEFLFHSVLSPLINVGLLSPAEVLDAALEMGRTKEISMNSLEGFVRQIMGWREFIRHVYVSEGRKQRTSNFWGFERKIPASFYTGKTGITPVDFAIKKALKFGYNHHIERLMILGNFMLLCEFDPNEVYRWFMEMYIDAYDWVMVPNVYGMICFADGGMMTSKPYISGSNYLIKMGGFKKDSDPEGWQAIWDGLFWRFMDKQRAFFSSNPRLGMLLRTWDNMSADKRESHLRIAHNYLDKLHD